jgi:hypothetical protein
MITESRPLYIGIRSASHRERQRKNVRWELGKVGRGTLKEIDKGKQNGRG